MSSAKRYSGLRVSSGTSQPPAFFTKQLVQKESRIPAAHINAH